MEKWEAKEKRGRQKIRGVDKRNREPKEIVQVQGNGEYITPMRHFYFYFWTAERRTKGPIEISNFKIVCLRKAL